MTLGRPVAAITIGPDGVSVEPIVDATKIAIALFTTIGAMALMFSRMIEDESEVNQNLYSLKEKVTWL